METPAIHQSHHHVLYQSHQSHQATQLISEYDGFESAHADQTFHAVAFHALFHPADHATSALRLP